MNTNITAGTIARTICLALALTNQILSATGHAVLPIKGKGSNDWAYSWIPVVGPVIGGFLLYLSELHPSEEFNRSFIKTVNDHLTDVIPTGPDLELVKAGKATRDRFQIKRSFRVIPFDDQLVETALYSFDNTVKEIETNVQSEIRDSKDVMSHWKGEYKQENCTACDAKTFCPFVKGAFGPTVP